MNPLPWAPKSIVWIASTLCLFCLSPMSSADEGVQDEAVAEPSEESNGKALNYFDAFQIDPALAYYFVQGDRGRFRQDWFVDDATTGGIEKLSLIGSEGDEVTYEFDSRALVNYDYLAHLSAKKKDDLDFDLKWKYFRKFWDGSQDKEVWDPSVYRLSGEFNDPPDERFHTDRGNVDFEVGKNFSDNDKIIFEYHLWTREGRDVTLRAEQAAGTGLRNLRAIGMKRTVDGYSNQVVVRAPLVIGDKYNVEPAISFEAYRDSQFIDSARYNNGALNQKRDYQDAPEFNDLQVYITADTFLQDEVYINGGYMFNFLRNDSTRTEARPAGTSNVFYENPEVDNYRVSNHVNAGGALLNFLRKQGLDMRLGFTGEHAVTDAHGELSHRDNGIRISDSNLREVWAGEAVSLTYRGLQNTTADASINLEQRRLHWNETYDARSHESVTNFGSTVFFPEYETYITHLDFVPRVRLTHRFNRFIKFYSKYQWKNKQRRYNTEFDNDPVFYPGILGDQERNVHEFMQDLDFRLPEGWTSKLRYQLIVDNITFQKAGDGQQDWDRDRFSLSFFGPLGDQLTFFSTAIYEYNRLDTPTSGLGTNRWSPGDGAYDFNGDVWILNVQPTYQIRKNMTGFVGYQITQSLGDNRNLLNEFTLGTNYNLSKDSSLKLRYFIFNFQDKRDIVGGGSPEGFDDDYYGHGFTVSFQQLFG